MASRDFQEITLTTTPDSLGMNNGSVLYLMTKNAQEKHKLKKMISFLERWRRLKNSFHERETKEVKESLDKLRQSHPSQFPFKFNKIEKSSIGITEVLPADNQNSVSGKYYAKEPRKDTWGLGKYHKDVLFKQTTEVLNDGNHMQEHLKRQYIVHPSLPIQKQTTFRNPSTHSSYQDKLSMQSVSDVTVVCAQDRPLLKSSSTPGVQQSKPTTKAFTSHKHRHFPLPHAEAPATSTEKSIGWTTEISGKHASNNKKTSSFLEQLSTQEQLLQCRYLRLTPSNIKTLLEQSNKNVNFHPHMKNVDSYTVVFGL